MEPVSKLAIYRRKKGLTQEQLAELSGVTTRTIQRIEKGAVVPHIQTLKMLADSLDIDTELLMDQPEGNVTGAPIFTEGYNIENPARIMNLVPLYHLLALGGLFLPGLNIILPFILWVVKKDENFKYDWEGRQTINFNITFTLVLFIATPLLIVNYLLGFPLLIISYLFMVVMSIINLYRSVKMMPVKYPLSIPFMKVKAYQTQEL
ncbi:MAG: helix-turn-helix domain-containing protein [Bacteroidota bacterium]